MRDRLVRGAIAGMLALPFVIAVNLSSYHLLHFAKARWVDAVSFIIYGHRPRSPVELALGFFAFFVSGGGLGALFVRFVLPKPGHGDYLFRGVGWGVGSWFATYALGSMFRISTLYQVAWQTALTQIIGVVGWGVIIGWLTKRWDDTFTDQAAVHDDSAPGAGRTEQELNRVADQLRDSSGLLFEFNARLSGVLDRLDELAEPEKRRPVRVRRQIRATSMSDTREQMEAKWGARGSDREEH